MNNQLQFLCIPHRTAPHLQSYEMCKSGGKPPTVKRRGGGGGGGGRKPPPPPLSPPLGIEKRIPMGLSI